MILNPAADQAQPGRPSNAVIVEIKRLVRAQTRQRRRSVEIDRRIAIAALPMRDETAFSLRHRVRRIRARLTRLPFGPERLRAEIELAAIERLLQARARGKM